MGLDVPGRPLHVAVLFGGRSGEHEVSLASARSVVANLDPDKYHVTLIGITKEGRWLLPAQGVRALEEGLCDAGSIPALLPADHDSRNIISVANAAPVGEPVDVVFPVLHGPYGEDGTVQGLLELSGLPYVGAGVLGSAVGMDKVTMKVLFASAGLQMPKFIHFRANQWDRDPTAVQEQIAAQIGFPCFVKPANLGSSVGITKVHNAGELAAALEVGFSFDLKVVVECSVENAREVECSVLGNDQPQASVPGEIIPSREFYSYEAKYLDEDSQLIIPAPLPEEATRRIQEMAVRAFEVTDCAGMARVDFLVQRETDEVFISEINTIPGFTRISMYPKLWEASGVGYRELLDRLIQLALERHEQRARLRTSYLEG